MTDNKECGNGYWDSKARNSIYCKILLVFIIIITIFKFLKQSNVLIFILIISISHFLKLMYTYTTWSSLDTKRELSGLDGPKFYIKANNFFCGKNWHKQNCWPKMFIPTIRTWTCITLIIYIIMYGSRTYLHLALLLSIIYWIFSMYPNCVPHEIFKSDIYGGNIILSLLITILIALEILK